MKKLNPLFALRAILVFFFVSALLNCRHDSLIDDVLPDTRGDIITATFLKHYTMEECDSTIHAIDTILNLPVYYDIDAYKVIYKTVDADGNETQASGVVFIPEGSDSLYPLVSYQHGTVLEKEDVPSRLTEETVLGVVYAPAGYVVCMPDYLGLGDSPGLHPYCHSQTEATAVIDLLRATRTLCSSLNVPLNNQLFLFGYSQGGHATMAATKEIQENYANEFTITASAPMSGPYDMSGAQTDLVLSDDPYGQPFYLPYLMFAYNNVYHMYNSPDDYLIPPYNTTLPPMFDGYHSSYDVNAIMPSVPKQIIKPEVLDDFISNPNNPFRLALEKNDLIDWLPTVKINMYYCTADELVSYQNSINAQNKFLENGSTMTGIVQPDPSGTHETCAQPCLVFGRLWFDSMKE